MTNQKYWYIYFESDHKRSWRIWKGRHPLDRLIDCPHQIPMFWQEVPDSIALEAMQKLGSYDYEKDMKRVASEHDSSVAIMEGSFFKGWADKDQQ